MANGYVAYRGPSMLDGTAIKVVQTGTQKASENRKTADMLQVYIFCEHVKPVEASRAGDDKAVCGDCIHKWALGGGCYVNLGWLGGIWAAPYPETPPTKTRNRPTRLGAYGDPAAAPYDVMAGLLTDAGHTGYTHQWRTCDQRFKAILMASVDSPAEYAEATEAGWRCYRVRTDDTIMPGEIECPEAQGLTKCADCLLCAGTSKQAKNITINKIA
jgi:hypothetical protein